MPNPTGQYLCSDHTLEKAKTYLNSLQTGAVKPSIKLHKVIQDIDFKTLSPIELIALLMNTRLPKILAETDVSIDGTYGWNKQEAEILGDISFITTGTHAYNNGNHYKPSDHLLDVNFLFVSGALLANGQHTVTPDMENILVRNETTKSSDVGEEAFYKWIENRLLPGLLVQNEEARKNGCSLVINIPGLGCGYFAGNFKAQVQKALPRVLKRLFDTHGTKLDMVRAVNFDPFEGTATDEFTTDKIAETQIKLMYRPFKCLPKEAAASQLEFPKDGTDYTNYRLIKVVAWDPFSFPGNDIWENTTKQNNGRNTDDGVSFASSDVILALFDMGQFSSDSKPKVEEVEYRSKYGIVYPVIVNNDGEKETIGYKQLSEDYRSHVSVEMLNVIPMPVTKLAKTSKVSPAQPEKDLTPKQPVPTSNPPVKELKAKSNLSAKFQKLETFIKDRDIIRQQFFKHLQNLDNALQQCSKSDASITDSSLIQDLTVLENNFFKALTPQTTVNELILAINSLRVACAKHVESADKVMGHGWLYRAVEVIIKAVVGLFAGIGMILGSFVCQGLLNAEHREKYAQTFFRLNQTDASLALNQFKEDILGDEGENLGLFSI